MVGLSGGMQMLAVIVIAPKLRWDLEASIATASP